MRTTLTLEDDVAALLERLQERRQVTRKDLVNDALRRGLVDLDDEDERDEDQEPATLPRSMGESKLANLDNIAEVLAHAESEDYR